MATAQSQRKTGATAARHTLYSQVSTADVLQAYDWSSDAQDLPADWDGVPGGGGAASPEDEGEGESSGGSSSYAWLHRAMAKSVTKTSQYRSVNTQSGDSELANTGVNTPLKPARKDNGVNTSPAKAEKRERPVRVNTSPAPAKPKRSKQQNQTKERKPRNTTPKEERVHVLLRNVPKATADALREQAKSHDQSLPAFVIALMNEAAQTSIR